MDQLAHVLQEIISDHHHHHHHQERSIDNHHLCHQYFHYDDDDDDDSSVNDHNTAQCHGPSSILFEPTSSDSLQIVPATMLLSPGTSNASSSGSTFHGEQDHYDDDDDTMPDDYATIKDKIVAHPSFRKLVIAYVNCRKVGAPPHVVKKLDELVVRIIGTPDDDDDDDDNSISSYGDNNNPHVNLSSCLEEVVAGTNDPELDDFMDAYCEALHKYHEDLIRPMDEAMAFLANIKLQVNNEDYNATMLMKDSYRDHHHHNYNQYAGLMEEVMDGEKEEYDDSYDDEYGEYLQGYCSDSYGS